jgi:hypothetical protein
MVLSLPHLLVPWPRHCFNFTIIKSLEDPNQGILTNWMAQYSWPPCANKTRLDSLSQVNLFYFFTK